MGARRILLGSGGFAGEERRGRWRASMRALVGPAQRLLFVPWALGDHERYLRGMVAAGLDAGYELEGLHAAADPVAAVRSAEALYVGGGNTFRLAAALHRHRVVEAIRERVAAGVPYVGASAGSNVACPTLMTTNDMPIVAPPTFETLGLVPFQINAHYHAGAFFLPQGEGFVPHHGETRDERIAEYHELERRPVVGLWEGACLSIEDGRCTLLHAPARIFERGRDPLDLEPGARLDRLLEAG